MSDPSKKYWWLVGIVVPVLAAVIGVTFRGDKSNNDGDGAKPTVVVVPSSTQPSSKPPCVTRLSNEHDDAQRAVHEYDQFIFDKEQKLALEKDADLRNYLESSINSLKESREKAAQRVNEIEQQCVP